jgi:transposase-like protein
VSQDELNKTDVPDPKVVPRAKRRRFSAEYKLRTLIEADACSEPGQIGALLRREGLYSSHLTTWRRSPSSYSLSSNEKWVRVLVGQI